MNMPWVLVLVQVPEYAIGAGARRRNMPKVLVQAVDMLVQAVPGIGVAQLVGQVLQLVSRQLVVVPEAAVVGGPGGALVKW